MYNLTCFLKWFYSLLTWIFKERMYTYKDHSNSIQLSKKSNGQVISILHICWIDNQNSKKLSRQSFKVKVKCES